MESRSQLVLAVGLHWGADLNDWASKARSKAPPPRNWGDLHTPPERGHGGSPSPCPRLHRDSFLSLSGDTPWTNCQAATAVAVQF